MRSSMEKYVIWEVQVRKVEVILGVNGVAMDLHGLILWENEATGSRKVFKYLWGLRDSIFLLKNIGILHKSQNSDFCGIWAIPKVLPLHSGRVGGMGAAPYYPPPPARGSESVIRT